MGFFWRWVSLQDGFLFEMGFFMRWASFRDYFCKLKRWASFEMNAANFEIEDCKTMSKTTTQIFQP